jgi:saccharopine dehydrogenase (NAD+, L-lysine-forming)
MEHPQQRGATWLVYGAYGYTGRLVVDRALELGERPVLAGRNADALEAMSAALGLEHRVFGLDDPAATAQQLGGIAVVAHCAGPFTATTAPMVEACLMAGVHYLDISGEIAPIEATFERDAEARAAGAAFVVGAGFDVVPSDCLAATVARELPTATELELAFASGGGFSRGTANTALEQVGEMSSCRIDGVIRPAPRERRTLDLELGGRRRTVSAVSWGDIATAARSTGIPTTYCYAAVPSAAVVTGRLLGRLRRVPALGGLVGRAASWSTRFITNPTDETRARHGSELWARATAPDGTSVERRMTTPHSYSLTADAVVRIAQRLRDGDVEAGVHTPSQALGPDFAATLDGVVMH